MLTVGNELIINLFIHFAFFLSSFFISQDCRGSFPIVKCTYCRSEFQQTRFVRYCYFPFLILKRTSTKTNSFVYITMNDLLLCGPFIAPYISCQIKNMTNPNEMLFFLSLNMSILWIIAKAAHQQYVKNVNTMLNNMVNHRPVNIVT